MKHQDLKRLLDVAKRRISTIDVNSLNNILDNKNDLLKKKLINDAIRPVNASENKIVKSVGNTSVSNSKILRQNKNFFTKLNGNFKRIQLPESGAFNGTIIRYNEEKIICVYRSDEKHFVACYLDNKYNPIKDSFHKLKISKCADPRLIWLKNNSLLLTYASVNNVSYDKEYICGMIIMDDKSAGKFIDGNEFRISSASLHGRQKNWMSFSKDGEIYFISSVCPHEIYHLSDDLVCKKLYTTNWSSPWLVKEHHRGSTNPIRLSDGNYLSTFHTSMKHEGRFHYDNGCYIFSGEPPFNVIKCANRTYLPAEAACEKHVRNAKRIVCNFPVGMMMENGKAIISYGDNDSCVKIVEYKLEDLLNTTIDVS